MKSHITVAVAAEVVERLRNAAYWTPGLTITSVLEECVAIAVDELERKNGGPYEKRNGPLKNGKLSGVYTHGPKSTE